MATVPFYRAIPALARDPLGGLESIVARAGPNVIRISLGGVRPYLVTRPEHIQQVLGLRAATYRREGMLWRPLRPLIGTGLAGEGESWARHRDLLRPVFAARHVDAFAEPMAQAIAVAVAALELPARAGEPIDVTAAMTRIAHRALVRVFFGDALSIADGDRLGAAVTAAFTALGMRLVLPFLPAAVPLPGDRAFRRAVREVDQIIYPLVASARGDPGRDDVVAHLWRVGAGTVREIRDDVVSLLAAGIETTAVALTWLWVVLDQHPEVMARLRTEIDAVVGRRAPRPGDLPDLRYARMVLSEVLRLYPPAWFFPRRVAEPDVIDGMPIRAGGTVLLSPYLTHRRLDVWDDPARFDPERFAADRGPSRHRYAYFPFAGGRHQCLGQHFFLTEALLVLAGVLARFQPLLAGAATVTPQAGVTLRPRQRVAMLLRPLG
jgi:cytochrome P450